MLEHAWTIGLLVSGLLKEHGILKKQNQKVNKVK